MPARNAWIIAAYVVLTGVGATAKAVLGLPEQVLLLVLVPPVLLVAFLRQRYIYITMLTVFFVVGMIITENFQLPITDSTITIIALLITMIVACEAIRVMARRESRLRRVAAENEQRLRTFIDNAGDAIFVVDERDRIVEMNEVAVEMFGYEREVLTSTSFEGIFGVPGSGAAVTVQTLTELRHATGIMIPVEISMGRSEVRRHTSNVFIVRNIGDRNRAEAQIRQAEAIRLSILETIPDYIMMLDLDYRVQFINRTVADLIVDGVMGTNIMDYVPSDEHSSTIACYERVRRTKKPGTFETRYVPSANGDISYFESRVAPIIEDGEVVGFTVSSSDVTERRRQEVDRLEFERRLLNSQKLESLGLLAGGVAHDFNNLLVAIMGRADLARADTHDPAVVEDHLQQILEASEHAAALCQQLLAYSGKGRFVIAPANLSEFVAETRKLLEISIPDNVHIEYDLTNAAHTIEADATQLRQVIMNLVTNAYEALHANGGTVVIRTGMHRLEHSERLNHANGDRIQDGIYAFLEVEDDGPGMSAETMERLFDPFYTTKPHGTGLGMAAVLGIIRGHNGAMSVTSNVGRGTIIRALLPAQPSTQERSGGAANVAKGSSEIGGTILVVDDEPAVRAVATAILERAKFVVVSADTGKTAIEMIRDGGNRVDAVVLDMKMPDMNGVQVMEQLRSIRPDLPILLSSGFSETEVFEGTPYEGASDFLPKPYLAEDLVAAVCGVLSPSR